MSDTSRATTEVTVLGKPYVIACPPEEQEQLKRSARYLDRAMHGIHSRGKVLGAEKIAIMAALNIAHELLGALDANRTGEEALTALNERLDKALASVESREPSTRGN